jgi:integrase/recombinase XerD
VKSVVTSRDFQEAYREKPRVSAPNADDFAGLAEAFRQHLEGRALSPATVAVRMQGLARLGSFVEERAIADVRQMTRAEVDAYVAELRRRKLSRHTVESWLGTCKRFFAFLVESNRLLISPAEHLHEKNLAHLVGPVISARNAEKLLAVPNTSLPMGVRDRAILEVLYGTGLRRAELVGLSVFDVDLAGGVLRVVRGKGGKERLVPVGNEAQKWLRLYLEKVRPMLARRMHGREGEMALLLARDGRTLTCKALTNLVATLGKAADVRVSCHTLRRTMATELLRSGAQLVEVGAMLGHARLTATQRYTKVAAADLRKLQAEKHPRGKR